MLVAEPTRLGGERPHVHDGALLLHDPVNEHVYSFGGVPWDRNDDRFSETRLPTSALFRLDIKTGIWWNYTVGFLPF